MSNIVQFLEALGASPNQLSGANYASAVDAAKLDDVARDALLARDGEQLNRVLGGRAEMRLLIGVAD